MTIKVVINFGVLLRLARDLAIAEKSGDPKKIEEAKIAHDNYRSLVLDSDEIATGRTIGSLI